MMRVVIAAVGRVREGAIRTLLDDYYARIRRYATLDEVEIRDERDDRVGAAFQRAVATGGEGARLIALNVTGRGLSSNALAERVGAMRDAREVPVFAIGGAEGLPAEVTARAKWALSLGPMTLPHRLARVVLAEQIYRSFSILAGEPYAREG